MNKEKNDAILKTIADTYIEKYGKSLAQEAEQLNNDNVTYLTPKLDSKVKQIIRNKGRRASRYIPLIAASIVLILLIPVIITSIGGRYLKTASNEVANSESGAMSEAADVVGSSSSGISENEEKMVLEGSSEGNSVIIPLSNRLPEGYSLVYSELDNGQTIHHIDSDNQDNVVVTISERIDDDWYLGLDTVDIDGTRGYYINSKEYKMLVFTKNNYIYTLTCQYEMNTIYYLSKYI